MLRLRSLNRNWSASREVNAARLLRQYLTLQAYRIYWKVEPIRL
tara:strand:- start:2401 stop:2532 length:132 start_codon:yes stop_codon:yes gene_type:complete